MTRETRSSYATVADFAKFADEQLKENGRSSPGIIVLTELFRVMYAASMATEEGQKISFELNWIDPQNPDPDPPERIVADRWTAVPFASKIPLTPRALVKAAKATDPRTSSFAVFASEVGSLFIWGVIDQGNRPYDFARYDSESGQDRPGIFQASAIGVGHLGVSIEYEPVAELRIDQITPGGLNPLRSGPIFEAFRPAIAAYISTVKTTVSAEMYEDRGAYWDFALQSQWVATLVRVLLRIRGMGHGGAVLITAGDEQTGLDIKYRIDYPRLAVALQRRGTATVEETYASDLIWEVLDADGPSLDVRDYLAESVAATRKGEAVSEIDGILWFIACLSRVDGLVLMKPDLSVAGFGTVITVEDAPAIVRAAKDDTGNPAHLTELSYDEFGTRHRSMMRYCNANPGSVGFVISQDGDIRAMCRVEDYVLIWDGVRLQRILPARDPGEREQALAEVSYQGRAD